MAFCSSCGKELPEGAAFCAGCGTKVGAPGTSPVRTQVFVGEVRKCPSCGAQVGSMDVICPECGGELTGKTGSSGAVAKLADKLSACRTDKEKYAIVDSIVVPTSVEDISELVILAKTQLQSINPLGYIGWGYLYLISYGIVYGVRSSKGYVPKGKMNKAWMKVIEQVRIKSSMTLRNAPAVQQQIDEIVKDAKKHQRKQLIGLLVAVGLIVLSYALLFTLN